MIQYDKFSVAKSDSTGGRGDSTSRDDSVDFYKGMLILGVIWGHAITALSLDHFDTGVWIHLFFRVYDMPFFMIISGFFLRAGTDKYPLITLLINRIGMIFIPIIVWNLLAGSYYLMGFYFLWAVFISSIVCGIGNWISKRTNWMVELFLYLGFIIFLHVYKLPWNLFYLFPFFCVGYYMNNLKFRISAVQFCVLLLLLSTGMCFWKGQYTPWSCGSDVWKIDMNAIWIYGFRFLLAIVATYIVANLFKMLYSHIPQNISRFVLKAGRETLALYVLQVFVIEILLQKIMKHVDTSWYDINADVIHNLIGYVVAPAISISTVFILLFVITLVKKSKWTRWIFGLKLIQS